MKFTCERCKTRYSIADDRVRGKVLKIRCKNCEFVITVREGMESPPEADLAERSARPTTMAPLSNKPAPPATAPAPPQLQEEWYVSIDGNQTGPLTLQAAQEWVKGHPVTADLHCWSEGFDDWLPVEKVSQLRGLRKPAPSKAPPAFPGKTESLPALSNDVPSDPFAHVAGLGRGVGPTQADDASDDDLSIGEVSRVVNLADLARQGMRGPSAVAAKPSTSARVGVRTPVGGVAALTAPAEPADAVTAGLALAAKEAQIDALADQLPVGVGPTVAQVPKRGNLMLILLGLLAAASVVIVVLFAAGVFSSGSDSGPRIDDDQYANIGLRIDDPRRNPDGSGSQVKLGSDGSNGAGSGSAKVIRTNPQNPNNNGNNNNGNNNGSNNSVGSNGKVEAMGSNAAVTELKADDVNDMFQKNSSISQRCYEFALKKDAFLDVKKVLVMVTVNKLGVVTDVGLSEHGNDQLGKCLVQRIKGWKFRESTSGVITRVTMVFGS
jgi:predicted Zn finger-like uncharacterized protein